MERHVYYYVDLSEHSEADYKSGVDMHWWHETEFNSKREAIAWAKDLIARHPFAIGVRVDRNDLKEGQESLETLFTLFKEKATPGTA